MEEITMERSFYSRYTSCRDVEKLAESYGLDYSLLDDGKKSGVITISVTGNEDDVEDFLETSI